MSDRDDLTALLAIICKPVTLVCTDSARGKEPHSLVQLGDVLIGGDGLLHLLVPRWPRTPGLWLDDVPGHSGPQQRLQARCPRCGGNPQFANGYRFVARLAAAGIRQVDISHLP